MEVLVEQLADPNNPFAWPPLVVDGNEIQEDHNYPMKSQLPVHENVAPPHEDVKYPPDVPVDPPQTIAIP